VVCHFLLIPLFLFLSIILDRMFGGAGADFDALLAFRKNMISIFPFTLFILIFGPVPEELAWRGYALNELEKRLDPFTASIILGIYWAVWHLPLFFIDGSYQHGLGVGTLQSWLFILDKLPNTFLMTWIFNKTDRSTIAAILFHFMMNFTGELMDLSLNTEVMYIGFLWLLVALILIVEKNNWFRAYADHKNI